METILIVDDERSNLNLLAEWLGDDYTIIAAKNGEQALKRANGGLHPDLILLDIMMPGMDGYQVLEHLQADPATRDIPVIFATAKDDSQDEARGFELGAADYISKPFSQAVVRARVRTHLALRRMRKELARHA